jgi:hypothetical protein
LDFGFDFGIVVEAWTFRGCSALDFGEIEALMVSGICKYVEMLSRK